MIPLEPKHLDAFERLLQQSESRRISGPALWAYFAQAFPGRPQGAEERRWFLSALEELASRKVIRLPSIKGNRWDTAFAPAVPSSVDLVVATSQPSARAWRSFPWHQRLAWVASLSQLASDQERFLLKIHEGLVNGTFSRKAPLKYRSLQLTGSEKKLALMLRSGLFGDGRLSLDLIGCFQEVPPLAWASVSDAPAAIIFENAGPFSVAREVLSQMKDSPYGIVAYGGGNGVLAALPHLQLIARPITTLHYVGDLDLAGLEIALGAQDVARRSGLPALTAAPGAHLKMLHAAKTLGGQSGWKISSSGAHREGRLEAALQFLPSEARELARAVIASRNRVPEEVLGPDELLDLFQSRGS